MCVTITITMNHARDLECGVLASVLTSHVQHVTFDKTAMNIGPCGMSNAATEYGLIGAVVTWRLQR